MTPNLSEFPILPIHLFFYLKMLLIGFEHVSFMLKIN